MTLCVSASAEDILIGAPRWENPSCQTVEGVGGGNLNGCDSFEEGALITSRTASPNSSGAITS